MTPIYMICINDSLNNAIYIVILHLQKFLLNISKIIIFIEKPLLC